MRFAGFEREWETTELNELGEFLGGGTPSSSNEDFWNGSIPWISSSDLSENDIYSVNISRFITEDAVSNSATKKCLAPVILIVSRVGVGKVAYSEKSLCTSQDFLNIVNFRCNGIFLSYLLSIEMKKAASVVQGTSIKGISSVEIKSKKLYIPQRNEQEKISSFLPLIDERIQTQNKIIENLKTQMLGLQEKIFRQKVKLKDSNGKSFPLWSFKKGGELFESISNKNHYSDLPILAITQDKGAIPRDLIDYQITVTERSVESYKIVEIGNFIISLRSFQGGIEHSDYKGICSPAYIILKNKIEIATNFYKYYFKTPDYIKLLNKKLEGIRDGKMISYSYFAEIELPFPSIEEQKRIASFLTKIDQKIQTEKAILEQLEMQKKYLLRQMFV